MAVKSADLSDALARELTIYSEDLTERINRLSEAAAKDLVKRTRETAPVGASGSYRKHITYKATKRARGNLYTWYVKAPDHRLTHLLVHGHATRNGGRTKPDPFLADALNKVLPTYEKDLEEELSK